MPEFNENNGHNGHKTIDPLDLLTEEDLGELAKKSEKWPTCPSCGAVSGFATAFCGQCGTQNPGFSAEDFQKELGASLEKIKEQEECDSGHGPAIADTSRIAEFCIYCGKKY